MVSSIKDNSITRPLDNFGSIKVRSTRCGAISLSRSEVDISSQMRQLYASPFSTTATFVFRCRQDSGGVWLWVRSCCGISLLTGSRALMGRSEKWKWKEESFILISEWFWTIVRQDKWSSTWLGMSRRWSRDSQVRVSTEKRSRPHGMKIFFGSRRQRSIIVSQEWVVPYHSRTGIILMQAVQTRFMPSDSVSHYSCNVFNRIRLG
jgi:hypothetical protein